MIHHPSCPQRNDPNKPCTCPPPSRRKPTPPVKQPPKTPKGPKRGR